MIQNFIRGDSLRASLNEFRSCFDVKYYDLSVTPNLKNHSISGTNQITMEAVKEFDRIQLDLFSNMFIDSIEYNENTLSFERVENAFFIQFPGTNQQRGEDFIVSLLSWHTNSCKIPTLGWRFCLG